MAEKKTLCIMGLFDSQTNNRVEEIKAQMNRAGFSADILEPHITFGIYSDLHTVDLAGWVGCVAPCLKRIPLHFSHVGIFPETGVCFIAPSVNRELLEMHEKLHARFDDFCSDKECLYSLRGGQWVPHVTLALLTEYGIMNALPIILDHFTPFTGWMTRIKMTEQEPLKDIAEFVLGER